MASFIQSFWRWRPQVAIIGESNSGKTTIFQYIQAIFGDLLLADASKSTAAGIRQAIANTSRIVFIDEFEEDSHRKEILEMLRVSGRGGSILRGSPRQRVSRSSLRHIVWVAAVESGLKREPDKNRFIKLNLLPRNDPSSGGVVRRSLIPAPDPVAVSRLGKRMLAAAIHHAESAVSLAGRLNEVFIPGINGRVIESLSVPVAMMASVVGMDEEKAVSLLVEVAKEICGEMEIVTDCAAMMQAIFNSDVLCGHERFTVGQLIEILCGEPCNQATAAEKDLERVGIRIDTYEKHGPLEEYHGCKAMVFAHKIIGSQLTRGSEWHGQSVEEHLERIAGAYKNRRRVAGTRNPTITIPLAIVEKEFFGDTKQKNLFSENTETGF
jgi:hypothetical protein